MYHRRPVSRAVLQPMDLAGIMSLSTLSPITRQSAGFTPRAVAAIENSLGSGLRKPIMALSITALKQSRIPNS